MHAIIYLHVTIYVTPQTQGDYVREDRIREAFQRCCASERDHH